MPWRAGSDVTGRSTPEARYSGGNGWAIIRLSPPFMSVPYVSELASAAAQRAVHDLACLVDNGVEVGLVLEAFGINLVHGLCAGGTRREPAAGAHDLEAADRSVVARSAGQLVGDRLARQVVLLDRRFRQFSQPRLLLGSGRHVDARIKRDAELCRDLVEMLGRILAGASGHLGRQKIHD